jgi:hypothetical protein
MTTSASTPSSRPQASLGRLLLGMIAAWAVYGASFLSLRLWGNSSAVILLFLGVPQAFLLLPVVVALWRAHRGLALGLVIGAATAWMLMPAACFGALALGLLK